MTTEHGEILAKVQTVLADALGVDGEDVTPEAKLRGDLGAESIDFLDILFRLERSFGIKLKQEEMFPMTKAMQAAPQSFDYAVQDIVTFLAERTEKKEAA
jgi:acyl carrier protein